MILWVWPWPQRPLPVPDWAGKESALRLSAESKKGEFSPRERWSPRGAAETWQGGSARLRLGGIEEGWLGTVRLAGSSVQFEDGATLGTRGKRIVVDRSVRVAG